jgi:hypothetical protein
VITAVLIKLLLVFAQPLSVSVSSHLNADAGLEQGFIALQQGNIEATLEIWHALADHGNHMAQFNLGQLYQNGNGVKVDDRKALKWYLMAARGGVVPALYNLTLMHEEGRISQADIDILLEFPTAENPSPPPPPAFDMESASAALQRLAPENYLIQLVATVDIAAMALYTETHRSAFQQQQVNVVQIQNKGRIWSVLLLGPYRSRESAKAAIAELPEAVKQNGPWIRQVSSVQAASAISQRDKEM